ncbi:MAG: DUF808 domain-containing protein, partial [Gammaproteobacteria bacterium]
AASSLFALIDDIATVLDDVSVLTKVSARKAAGVLGDDLALNAQQVTGVRADRELPVVWAVAKGSTRNKLILVPTALAISAFAPWAVTPLLMAGGLFLCYEGFEKIAHGFLRDEDEPARHAEHEQAMADPAVDPVALERDKIKGAVRTDFVLSAEIVAITLGTVATAPFVTRLIVLAGIAALMTVGVYGVVAGIVKLDDAGRFLSLRKGEGIAARGQRRLGFGILRAAPWMMKALSVAGTAAMFLVGGSILTHGVTRVHHWIEDVADRADALPAIGDLLEALTPALLNAGVGILAGAVALALVSLGRRLWPAQEAPR